VRALRWAWRPQIVVRAYLLLVLASIVVGLVSDRKLRDGTFTSRAIVGFAIAALLTFATGVERHRRRSSALQMLWWPML
jgi:hypothetical protein